MCDFQILVIVLGQIVLSVASDYKPTSKMDNYEKLRRTILKRPVVLHKMPPDVFDDEVNSYTLDFRLWLIDVYDIDELNQVITLNAYIEVRWTQKQLSWDPSHYGGIDSIYVDIDQLWTPMILIVMGQKDSFVLEFAPNVQVTSEGMVISSRHNHLTFSCSIDFDKYPFDVQSCSVGFYPTGINTVPNVSVSELKDYSLSDYVNVSGEWIFLGDYHEIVKTAGHDNTTFPRYYFKMKRQRTYYIITFILPMVLTSVMIPLAFLIPAYSGEKISYLVAMFTSTAIYLNYISDVMPRSLSQMPYLAVFLIEVLLEGLLAMLVSLMIVGKYLKEQCPPPQMIGMRQNVPTCYQISKNDAKEKPKAETTSVDTSVSVRGSWNITSRKLDIIFFLVFMSLQIIFLLLIFGAVDWL